MSSNIVYELTKIRKVLKNRSLTREEILSELGEESTLEMELYLEIILQAAEKANLVAYNPETLKFSNID